jgi:beta-galactosidase/beta-glucuronidase
MQVEIKPPYELWWPNGYGGQRLYGFRLAYTQHGASSCGSRDVRVGLRSIELRREPLAGTDAASESFEFVVNTVPIFAKGTLPAPVPLVSCRGWPNATACVLR